MRQAFIFFFLVNLFACKQRTEVNTNKDIIFEQYFPLKSGNEKIFYVSHITDSDTLVDENDTSFCMSYIIENKEIFFFTDSPSDSNSIIGSESFCNGVFYFKDGKFFISPIFWQADLKEANLNYFEALFPRQIVLDRAYTYQDGEEKRKYTFTTPEDVTIKEKLFPACLKLTVIQDWPTEQYADTVWFQKNIGVIKWLRSTGRLEEIKL